MKVKHLIEKLQEADPNMEVYCTSNTGDWDYCKVYTAEPKFLAIEDAEGEASLVFIIDEQ